MSSLFDGTGQLICDALGIEQRQHLSRKSQQLTPLTDQTAFLLVERLYDKIADNVPGRPYPPSEELWRCSCQTCIADRNPSPEKMLEKAVAILANEGHMPGWSNQCPVATGVADRRKDRKRSVDLVHLAGRTLRLVELKWETRDTPAFALFEVLEYGLAYLLARLQRYELALEARELLQDSIGDVRLEVVAPSDFYAGNGSDLFLPMHNAVARFADSRTNGQWTMSLQPLAFPDSFDAVPFASGEAVKRTCARRTLSPEGRTVREAFAKLVPLSPSPTALER